ncbi:MAG: integrase [Nitrospirales bacterium]|nr:MAG: integrase [Nitrospirales bacterium]
MARSTKGLYKRGNVWWMTYRDALGVQQFESCKTRNKAEAEKRLIHRRKETIEGISPVAPIKPVALETLFEEYLKFVGNQRGVRTKRLHVQHLKRELRNPPIHTLTVKVIEDYRVTREFDGVGPATINREISTLKHALTKAVSWQMVRKSIRDDLRAVRKLAEPAGRLRYLSGPEEASTLIEGCRGIFRVIVVVTLHTGMRRGEVLGLTWEAVDLKHGFIRLTETKNGEARDIPINDTVWSALNGLRTRLDVPYVFHDEEGKPFKDTRHKFEWACKRAGITDFHFHDLRHTFASWLVMKGVPLATVSKLLGHKSISMTMRYAHLSPDHLSTAVKALDHQGFLSLDNYLTIEAVREKSDRVSMEKIGV